MERKMFTTENQFEVTQGSIFTNVYHELYEKHPIMGIIITARCDLANPDKINRATYLPVVPFERWKCVEFPLAVRKAHLTSYKKTFFNQLSQYEISERSF